MQIMLAFLAGVLGVVGLYSLLSDLFFRDRSRMGQRIDDEFRQRQRERAKRSALFKDLGALAAEAGSASGDGLTWRQRLELLIEQAGLEMTVQRLLTLMAVVGLAPALLVGLYVQSSLAAVAVFAAAATLPLVFVHLKRRARMNRLLGQLPDAFDLMSRVIRAGQTMSQGLQAVADEFDPPIAAEFAYCYEQQNLGLAPELALRDLGRRTGLLEIKIFILAMLIQQQTGGNLAELLDKLAHIVRERFKMKGKISVLTAEGRMQAIVLLALPPALLVLVMLLNYSYARVLFDHPTILVGMFIAEAIGALWIRKIVNFDF